MRSSLRVAALGLAVLAAGCTNGDKPTMDNNIAGPTLGRTGGCSVTIGDRVWFDVNCNGIQDKDETGGPEGVKITLTNCDTKQEYTTTTDSNGNYSFNVPAGTYITCIDIPEGFVASPEDAGGVDGLDSDGNTEGCTACRAYECDKPDLTRDFGLCEKKGEEPKGCRFTGGGNSSYHNDVYTFGGQAGANTALQPQPAGEWEHNNHDGPSGDFAFHGGTHSAPDGTEIDRIECSDPGFCNPARHAPAHQLDFWGVGQFHSAKKLPGSMSQYITVGESLHWFEVNVDDSGEPGHPNTDADCPEDGFGLHGSEAFVNCDCGDFYRITIRRTTDPNSPVLYTVHGYFQGNFQIHPLTGFDAKGQQQH